MSEDEQDLHVELRVYRDCLAAIGMLKFPGEPAEDPQADDAGLRAQLPSIRSLRGDN